MQTEDHRLLLGKFMSFTPFRFMKHGLSLGHWYKHSLGIGGRSEIQVTSTSFVRRAFSGGVI